MIAVAVEFKLWITKNFCVPIALSLGYLLINSAVPTNNNTNKNNTIFDKQRLLKCELYDTAAIDYHSL